MVVKQNTLEGGTNGATITTGNSGGGSGDAFDFVGINGSGATLTYDNARGAHGSQSAKYVPVASQTIGLNFGSSTAPFNTGALASRFYLYLTALPTDANLMVSHADSAGARLAGVYLDATGKLYVRDTGTTPLFTAASAIPLNQWVRVEFWTKIGAAGTGELHFAYYVGDSTSAVQSYDNTTTAAMGTTNYGVLGVGKLFNSAYVTPFWVDDVKVDSAPTGLVGPAATSATSPVYPTSVAANAGGWTNQGAAATLQAATADTDDTTFARSPGAATNETLTLGLGALSAGSVTVTVRARPGPTGGVGSTFKMELLEGGATGTVRATSTQSFTSSGFVDYSFSLTSGENAAITDRTNLAIRLTGAPA